MEAPDPTTIYCDNLNNIQLAKNPIFHARTKYIGVHYHFVRECVLLGEVALVYVLTDRQAADIFPKTFGLDKLRQFSGALGLQHLEVPNLRGRKEQEGSRSDSKPESDVEIDFGSAKAAEHGHGGSNQRKNPQLADQGGV